MGTGPFADAVMHVGPNTRFQDHCLNRRMNEDMRFLLTTANIETNITSQTTYDTFWNALDGFPYKPDFRLHDAGHSTMGGDMTSFYTSTNGNVPSAPFSREDV